MKSTLVFLKSGVVIVAPLAGAWVEINIKFCTVVVAVVSLPSRERGLKSLHLPQSWSDNLVAPLAGAWVEIRCFAADISIILVAPLAGAWVEIPLLR